MEKVVSVFSFELMGNVGINPFGEKPSFVSRTLENKVNYFVSIDREQGMPGSTPIPTFCYYPVKTEIVGGRLILRKFPSVLTDGILMLARKKAIEITVDEISRGRIILGDRVEDFAALAERYESIAPAVIVTNEAVDPLSEVDLFTYTANPMAHWL